jgi:hypothetical protein
MQGEEAFVGVLCDEKGEHAIARLSYRLERRVALDGFEQVTGQYALLEELSPVHTGLAQLVPADGERLLVRVTRITRPSGEGEFEVIGPAEG